jgi:membrane dipeptidase
MISRRQFTKALGGAVTLTALKPGALWSGEPTTTVTPASVSPGAAELYRKIFVIDGNVLAAIGFPISSHDPVGVTKQIVGSGVNVVKATLGGPQGNFEQTVAAIARAELLMEEQPEAFFKVHRATDFDRAKTEGKVGVIYSFESPNMFEDKIDRIELFHSLGVRVMQLTYNHRTAFGCGCLDGDTDGLTDLGRSAVAKMNEVGVALDLSHSNTKTTADATEASKKPVLITHAGCRAVYMHPRNKEDRELKALAEKGGVIGIYMLPFLTEPAKQPMLKDFLQHLDHAVKVCGEDHVGIGTDIPFLHVGDEELAELKRLTGERKAAGIAAPGEDRPAYIPDLNTERKLELVTDALLKRGYKNAAVEKILGGNFRRVLADIWSA